MAYSSFPPPPPRTIGSRAGDWALRAAGLQASLPPRSPDSISRLMRASLSSLSIRVVRVPARELGWPSMLLLGLVLGGTLALIVTRLQRAAELEQPSPPPAPAVAAHRPPPPPAPSKLVARPKPSPGAIKRAPARPRATAALALPVSPPAESEPVAPSIEASFDRAAAASELASAAASAKSCSSEPGATRVSVTFAGSGRATRAMLEPGSTFSGSAVGSCIATRMRAARVPPFSGPWVTVHTTVAIP